MKDGPGTQGPISTTTGRIPRRWLHTDPVIADIWGINQQMEVHSHSVSRSLCNSVFQTEE